MITLEERVAELEKRLSRIEPHVNRTIPMGPRELTPEELRDRGNKLSEIVKKHIKDGEDKMRENAHPCVDRSNQELVSGAAVPSDESHTELKPNGQQKDYIVLTPEERAKGFVRPVRQSYIHRGVPKPNNLRDLTPEEHARWAHAGYVKFEDYNDPESPARGRFYTQAQIDNIGAGCGTKTTMSMAIAETYARDPKFYGGTFCCGCGKHLPLNEFVWNGTDEELGS